MPIFYVTTEKNHPVISGLTLNTEHDCIIPPEIFQYYWHGMNCRPHVKNSWWLDPSILSLCETALNQSFLDCYCDGVGTNDFICTEMRLTWRNHLQLQLELRLLLLDHAWFLGWLELQNMEKIFNGKELRINLVIIFPLKSFKIA